MLFLNNTCRELKPKQKTTRVINFPSVYNSDSEAIEITNIRKTEIHVRAILHHWSSIVIPQTHVIIFQQTKTDWVTSYGTTSTDDKIFPRHFYSRGRYKPTIKTKVHF